MSRLDSMLIDKLQEKLLTVQLLVHKEFHFEWILDSNRQGRHSISDKLGMISSTRNQIRYVLFSVFNIEFDRN